MTDAAGRSAGESVADLAVDPAAPSGESVEDAEEPAAGSIEEAVGRDEPAPTPQPGRAEAGAPEPASIAESRPGGAEPGGLAAVLPGPGPAHPPARRTRRAGRAPDAHPTVAPSAAGRRPGRPARLRLAHLHLAMGQLQLARAELEALAGRAALDEAALLDLAEARWRTGDLAGAGEAAAAHIALGRDDALALLIAAESVAAEGRPGEARRLAARAMAVVEGPLDPVFAGMPRSLIWPEDGMTAAGLAAALGAGAATGHADHPHAARARHAAGTDGPETPASTAAAEAYAGGRAALAGGDVGVAAHRLGIALRLDPGFAEGVLEAVGAWERDPALALVAGDALRLLGREAEALVAFDQARGRG